VGGQRCVVERNMLSRQRAEYRPIRNVQRVRRGLSDGRCNYHHYHRPTRTKLPGQPGSPEFMALYAKCEHELADRNLPCIEVGLSTAVP